jgi:glutathione S-transferase
VLKVGRPDGEDAVLFESMVTCEYLEESQGGATKYPDDALARAGYRGWIEFDTATLADGWHMLRRYAFTIPDMVTSPLPRAKSERIESLGFSKGRKSNSP